MAINIQKQLAGAEDILLGQGQVNQDRGGTLYPITKLNASNIPYSGDQVNNDFVALLDKITPRGSLSLTVSGGSTVLTVAQFNNTAFTLVGTLTSNLIVTIPDNLAQMFVIDNATTGAFTATIKHATTAGVTVAQGSRTILRTTGTVVEALSFATLDAQNEVAQMPAGAAAEVTAGRPNSVLHADSTWGDIGNGVANGVATLNAQTEVVQLPAGAAAEVTAGRPNSLFHADGTWGGVGTPNGVATLNAQTEVVQLPAGAAAEVTAGRSTSVLHADGTWAGNGGGSANGIATLNAQTEVVQLPAGAAAEVTAGRPTSLFHADGTWSTIGRGAANGVAALDAQAEVAQMPAGAAAEVTAGRATSVLLANGTWSALGSFMPVGTIIAWLVPTLPAGYLKANGATVSRITYADLFVVFGVTYGSGDGSTTFGLPDTRGEFLRGWDDARGVDVGRILGTWQADELKSHTHSAAAQAGAQYGQPSGQVHSGSGNIGSTGGVETRPRNIAVQFIIKY